MNKIIVIGNLGRDPEMRYTPNGQGVTSFSVASSRKYTTSSGEQREETEWFNCSAFGKLADTFQWHPTRRRRFPSGPGGPAGKGGGGGGKGGGGKKKKPPKGG